MQQFSICIFFVLSRNNFGFLNEKGSACNGWVGGWLSLKLSVEVMYFFTISRCLVVWYFHFTASIKFW